MNVRAFCIALLLASSLLAQGLSAAQQKASIAESTESFALGSKHLAVEFSTTRPQLLRLAIDSLGLGRFQPSGLRPPAPAPRPTAAKRTGTNLEYRRQGLPGSAPARWTFQLGEQGLTLVSRWSEDDPPEPVVLEFDPHVCHATLLGRIKPDGSVQIPALLHFPDQGTFRIAATDSKDGTLGYDACRTGTGYVRITLPPATSGRRQVEYRWEVVAIYPRVAATASDPRFNGFRRNWLNILQLNPRLRVLANHAGSDSAAFCYYEYADIARYSPPLAEGLGALDLVRQSLDRILAEMPAYGMPNYALFDGDYAPARAWFREASADTYPSLLITAWDYFDGTHDKVWLAKNYPGIRKWAEKMLATDRSGNGLIEYIESGDSGSWPLHLTHRPSNWWDGIGFGHEDAYANALAYRALRGMERLAAKLDKTADAARYHTAADKLRAAYFKTFYNPATGVLAGWKSADGQLHDYYFLWVNGIAIHYGLVSKDRANAIMDRLMAKVKAVGYNRFDLGLPGNLIPIPRKDYVDLSQHRWGAGQKEDGSDGFQIYQNGGASACFAFFTLAALYDLGRREEADRILFPMLDGLANGKFQGFGPNGMTNDWKAWDGTPWGYEGLLVDNYYVLLAVLAREGLLEKE
ncbi:MAG: hypothetical protein ABSG68_18380 [Thermoguttaceae bacterium]|jgi:hypothetical protein